MKISDFGAYAGSEGRSGALDDPRSLAARRRALSDFL
jgi:hypothetical protein